VAWVLLIRLPVSTLRTMASPEPFGIDTVTDGDRVRLVLRGELDLLAAPSLRTALVEASHHDGAMIELDLSAVSFIDSTGISVILQAWQRANAEGGRVVLAAASPVVARVIEATGLTELLAVDH
jgi:anti-sigma B factor antagonist